MKTVDIGPLLEAWEREHAPEPRDRDAWKRVVEIRRLADSITLEVVRQMTASES